MNKQKKNIKLVIALGLALLFSQVHNLSAVCNEYKTCGLETPAICSHTYGQACSIECHGNTYDSACE